MSFAALLALDARLVFANPAEFGEAVTYTPKGAAARALRAQVDRPPPEQVPGTPASGPVLHVLIPYSTDATLGLSSVNVGGDRITLPERWNDGDPLPRVVCGIVSQDAGGWMLKVR